MMLASAFEKAEGMERIESARRHDPATLVELQNANFTRRESRGEARFVDNVTKKKSHICTTALLHYCIHA